MSRFPMSTALREDQILPSTERVSTTFGSPNGSGSPHSAPPGQLAMLTRSCHAMYTVLPVGLSAASGTTSRVGSAFDRKASCCGPAISLDSDGWSYGYTEEVPVTRTDFSKVSPKLVERATQY